LKEGKKTLRKLYMTCNNNINELVKLRKEELKKDFEIKSKMILEMKTKFKGIPKSKYA
jgi:tRNA isopentenyl-2-thiomethyl-A-37 hydroxylase MiaE